MGNICYILYSPSTDPFYKGSTTDMDDRLSRHNAGREKATGPGRPWKLLCRTAKSSRAEAMRLEIKLKNLNRRRTLEFMMKYQKGVEGPDGLLLVEQLSGC